MDFHNDSIWILYKPGHYDLIYNSAYISDNPAIKLSESKNNEVYIQKQKLPVPKMVNEPVKILPKKRINCETQTVSYEPEIKSKKLSIYSTQIISKTFNKNDFYSIKRNKKPKRYMNIENGHLFDIPLMMNSRKRPASISNPINLSVNIEKQIKPEPQNGFVGFIVNSVNNYIWKPFQDILMKFIWHF